MTKTTSKTAAISELATANDTAITAQATSPAPITSDISTALETFTARPAVAASLSALVTTGDGVKSVWEFEQQNQFGRSVVLWAWDIFTAVALPLLSLVWLALNKGYVWALTPHTRAAAAEKWAELKVWAALKFDYENTSVEVAKAE